MSTHLYRLFLPALRPYRGALVGVLLASLARPLLNAARVWLLKVLIDDVLRGGRPDLLVLVCAGYLVIALARGVTSFTDDYLAGWVGANVVRDLRARVYDSLQTCSLRFFHRQRLGDLLTRITGDIGAMEDLLVSGVADTLAHGLTVVVFFGMLVYLDRSLALVALAVLPALALASVNYARRSHAAQIEIRERASTLASVAEEGLSAVALVKTFARESFESARFSSAAAASSTARLRSVRLRALFTPLVDVLATLGTALVVWFGAQAVFDGRLSVGGLVVFIGYLGSMLAPIQALGRMGSVVQRALVGAERVAEVLEPGDDARERRTGLLAEHIRGRVEFRDVWFGYTPSHAVLRGFNLSIEPGEIVALVGASGAGKTTVVSLLLAYYDADSGEVVIDGHPMQTLQPPAIRRQVGAVLQEPMLFQASVRENLRYGRLTATDQEIEAAARAAQADGFIQALPEGYDTPVGPRGARLSGGQRQRLAIARALLKNAPILVLDEATSALDAGTEAEVLNGLAGALADRAVLVVAHRLSTVRHADRIAVLHEGRVVEHGTHEALLAQSGHYMRFWNQQLGQATAHQTPRAAEVGAV